ncbi:MAG: signal peptidase I [Candidatus Nitrosopolaris sp.]|jgi:signal peptidase I
MCLDHEGQHHLLLYLMIMLYQRVILNNCRSIFTYLTLSKPFRSFNFVALVLVSLVLMPAFMYAQTPPVNSTYIMIGNSMSPNIRDNDGMVVDSHFPFNKLNVGDIIVFNSYDTTNSGQHIPIIHRVAQIITDDQGDRIIRTKGDANPDSIPGIDYPVFQQNYIGKVVSVIPQLETVSANNGVASNTMNNDFLILATIGLAAVIGAYFYRKIHK